MHPYADLGVYGCLYEQDTWAKIKRCDCRIGSTSYLLSALLTGVDYLCHGLDHDRGVRYSALPTVSVLHNRAGPSLPGQVALQAYRAAHQDGRTEMVVRSADPCGGSAPVSPGEILRTR